MVCPRGKQRGLHPSAPPLSFSLSGLRRGELAHVEQDERGRSEAAIDMRLVGAVDDDGVCHGRGRQQRGGRVGHPRRPVHPLNRAGGGVLPVRTRRLDSLRPSFTARAKSSSIAAVVLRLAVGGEEVEEGRARRLRQASSSSRPAPSTPTDLVPAPHPSARRPLAPLPSVPCRPCATRWLCTRWLRGRWPRDRRLGE